MHDLCMLGVIVNREDGEAFTAFFHRRGLAAVNSALAQGTANARLLSLMGLEKTEKTLLYALTPRTRAKKLLNRMVGEMGLDMPGGGVAFTVPLGSLGGESSLTYFTQGQEIQNGEVTEMPATFLYELIIAIANRGHAETVMDAARSAGAMGGTVVHAKGTNPMADNRFFGMSIADEKEMLLILTTAREKNAIMRAIMEKAGVRSPAHTVMFTVPVESVAGLKSVMEAAGEAEE